MTTLYRFISVIVFLSFLMPSSVLAQSNSDCLSLHVIENEPLGYVRKGSSPRGVHWDYLTLIEQESGLCIDKLLMPYARIWKSIEQGHHDGGIVFRSPQRTHLVNLVAPVREVKTVVIAAKGKPIAKFEDLYDLNIGKTRGTQLSDRFDTDKNLNLIRVTSYEQAAQMLVKGRIDALAGSSLVVSYQLFVQDVADELDVRNKVVLGSRTQWLQLSNRSSHLDKIPALAAAVNKLTKNGQFERIMDKYYGPSWREINQ